MKRWFILVFIVLLCGSARTVKAQGAAINSDASAADTSAMLDVKSTTKGLLPPRMSAFQRGNIPLPAKGLVVYQLDGASGLYVNNGTPTSPGWALVGPAPSLAYGSFYDEGTQIVSVGGFVTWNTIGLTSNITWSVTSFTIVNTGIYHIQFNITNPSNPSNLFGVFINGVQSGPNFYSSAIGAPVIGDMIIAITAGSDLSIRNTGGTQFLTTPIGALSSTLTITQIQ